MGKIIGIDLGTTNSCVAIMEGNSTKVIVDTDGGNNVLYLPLDQLTQRRARTPALEPSSAGAAAPPASSPITIRAIGMPNRIVFNAARELASDSRVRFASNAPSSSFLSLAMLRICFIRE